MLGALTNSAAVPAVIANGATESGVVDLSYYKLAAIQIPAMTGTTLTFKAAESANGTFYPVYKDDGTLATLTVSGGRIVAVDIVAGSLAALRYIKLVSGASEAAERTLTLFLKV